ncbi:hypothetical protein CHL67_01950 [Prosthecochloris sp. GSB1]|uniref:glycosyltransferase family 2 protein n=1 Tax=Prosthecochloris sp. GSB1 TaxID=281093 RepID=UPI000B8C9383|nr:glycosyltransferase [Prosthecochloris sp. GSB1]ASQ89846.1 hypothetical protein CHL67_01950 [Prosthecochloris sp. GSB1]
MSATKIIGIMLVKNEDRFIGHAIRNILEFCDEIIVADNGSRDTTLDVVGEIAKRNRNITVSHVDHPRQSHELIEAYAGTDTWIFGVDGDEIYDPSGLRRMKERIVGGAFDDVWCIYGNVLNCISIDVREGVAEGYLAPPSRSMTKLYNFSLAESWTDCPERLHSGALRFRPQANEPRRLRLYKSMSWETSSFRCLHAVFMQRSSLEASRLKASRLNPAEIQAIRSAYDKKSYVKGMLRYLRSRLGPDWKNKKYRRGSLTQKNIDSFFSSN